MLGFQDKTLAITTRTSTINASKSHWHADLSHNRCKQGTECAQNPGVKADFMIQTEYGIRI